MKNKKDKKTIFKVDNNNQNDFCSSRKSSKKYTNTKRQISSLCKVFTMDSNRYKPSITINNIESYIQNPDKLDRILYSEISNYIFKLDTISRGTFQTNIEKLLLYSLDEHHKVSEDCKKIIIKIYDHVQLVSYQIENTGNIFKNNIKEAKDILHTETKGIQKEYITILGIFASIVLTFVGGITFSTSVLQNIHQVSIFRLIFIIDIISIVMVNTIHILTSFIFKINEREDIANKSIFFINLFFSAVLIADFLLWFFNIYSFR